MMKLRWYKGGDIKVGKCLVESPSMGEEVNQASIYSS